MPYHRDRRDLFQPMPGYSNYQTRLMFMVKDDKDFKYIILNSDKVDNIFYLRYVYPRDIMAIGFRD